MGNIRYIPESHTEQFYPTNGVCTAPPDSVIFTTAMPLGWILYCPPQHQQPNNNYPPTDGEYEAYKSFAASLPDHVQWLL
eukprot:7929431-Ditylum_brightwellii.AAC.1